MKKNLYVILPIPRPPETKQWDRVLPMDLFPGGIRDLVVVALENESNFDSFFSDIVTMLEFGCDDDRKPAARRTRRLMTHPAYLVVLELLLQDFFNELHHQVQAIAGATPLYFVRVVTYRSAAGVVVELNRERHPKVHYCPAR